MDRTIPLHHRPDMSGTVEAGTVVGIHSLQSAEGMKLNGERAVVIRYHPDQDRWQVLVENETEDGATKALKTDNLRPLKRLAIPTGSYRGFATDDTDTMVPKLCELLLYYREEPEVKPSDIVFTGYACMALKRIGEEYFGHFHAVQLEQMGAVLALGNLCRVAEEGGCSAVLFGLLEGDPIYVDVLIQTVHWTALIDEDDSIDYDVKEKFRCPPTELTPDQDSKPYVRVMLEGPVLLLEWVSKYCFAEALWAACRKSEFYHLLVQRLLRWIAREKRGTRDGLAIGKKARKILSSMYPSLRSTLNKIVSQEVSNAILLEEPSSLQALCKPSDVTSDSLMSICNKNNMEIG